MVVDRFPGRHRVLEVADQLFVPEQLLGEVVLAAEPLVLDAFHQRQALAAVDRLRRELDEFRRVLGEVVQASAAAQDAVDAASGQPRPVLEVRQRIRQIHAGVVEIRGAGFAHLAFHPAAPQAEIALLPQQAGARYRGRVGQRPRAGFEHRLVVETDPEGRLVLDALPEGLELGALQHRLAGLHPAAFVRLSDLDAGREPAKRLGHGFAQRLELFRQGHTVAVERFPQRIQGSSLAVHIALRDQMVPEPLRRLDAERPGFAVLALDDEGRERVPLHQAEADPRFLLDLPLQVLGELLVALAGDDGQGVHLESALPLAGLVDAEAQAPADGLPAFPLRRYVPQGADLEHVGVVPAFAERRMGEDELQGLLEAEQPLLVAHDQPVCAFGVVAVGLVVLGGVGPAAPAVDGEVAFVGALRCLPHVHPAEPRPVLRPVRGPPVLLLEDARVLALDGVALVVVAPVVRHLVDEEEGEHLDAPRPKPQLLVQVLADRLDDHLPVDGGRVHAAVDVSGPHPMLVPRQPQLQVLVAPFDTDLADPMIPVHRAPRLPLQLVAVGHLQGAAPHPAARCRHVHLDLGPDGSPLPAGRHQADVGPVVIVGDHPGRHLDLLHQLAFVRVHRIEPVDHVVLVRVGRRVAQGAERVHHRKRLAPLPLQAAVHALRLVDDQHRVRRAHQIDGFLAARLLVRLVDVVDVPLVDGADGHHHDLHLRAGGEVPNLSELRGVVHEVLERRARIERAEVRPHDLQRLVDPFPDGDGRHDDGELRESVPPVELEDGPQVHVGLAGAGLHLHREVTGLKMLRRVQAVPQLHLPKVVQQLPRLQSKPVPDPEPALLESG